MRYVVLIFSKLNLSQYVGLKMVNGKMVGRCVVCRYVAKNANVARRYRSSTVGTPPQAITARLVPNRYIPYVPYNIMYCLLVKMIRPFTGMTHKYPYIADTVGEFNFNFFGRRWFCCFLFFFMKKATAIDHEKKYA